MAIDPFLSFYLPIHSPVPFSPSTSVSVVHSLATYLSLVLPFLSLLSSGTSFLSALIWTVITLALTLSGSYVTVLLPHYWCSASVDFHFTP